MKKRILSFLLAFVMILGILPAGPLPAFAASSEEEALGEVDIFNGDHEIAYLSINGSVRKQKYTYYNFKSVDGYVRETPAYCVNPNLYGVPQTVGPGESIKYLANEKASDPKVVGIICNGYPHYSLEALHLDDKYQAYYATKMALWCYLMPAWNINSLKVAPGLSAADQEIANRVLNATKEIYQRGTTYNYILEPKLTATPDKSVAYPVTVNGRQYKQQVFTLRSETFVYDYKVTVAFADPGSVPAGTRIVDMDNQDITDVITDGSVGSFKVLYPMDSIKGETGSVQLSLTASVAKYAVMYAVCAEKDKYGNLQNYICDVDNHKRMELAAVSNYFDTPEDEETDETALKIIKLEEGTEMPLEGAVFSVYDPLGRKLGSWSTGYDGTVTIPLTLEGHYTVTEEIPPKYHLLPNITTQHADVEYNKVAEVTFWNAPYGSLRVQKVSDTGDALNGVTVQIKHIESGEVLTGQTRMGGTVVFDYLKPGGYEVKEVAGISGWVAETDTVQTVAVVSGEESTATIVNKELPGLRIIKYDRKNMALMSKVTFAVYRDGEFLGNFQTDEFGEILITDARPGTYRAFEVDTGSDSHILDTTPQEVELHAGDGIKELLFFNDVKPGLRLVKVDSADPSKVIPNAVFEIKSVKGDYDPEEFRTDQDGEIDLSKLPIGAYVVTEKACEGYIIDEAQRIIQLDGNEDAEFVFTNTIKPSIQIVKRSSDGTPLGGVHFRIARIEDGSRYLDRVTDQNGEISISGLEPGVYSVRETATTSNHIIDVREYHVELFPGKTSTLTVENQKRPNLTIWKRDADTGELVPNTVFLVKAADGHSVNEVKTGPDGKGTLENLLPGVYEISEKSVPEPYLKDAANQLVTLYPNKDREVLFENHKRPSIEIIKENSITHERQANVPFQVWYASNNTSTGEYNDLGVFYTNAEGRIVLTEPDIYLRDGWFRVKELEAPHGFAIADPDTQEAFIPSGTNHTFVFQNRPLSAICVWKYDSVSPNMAIEGAVFQIRYLSGNTSGTGGTVIGTYRTGQNGSFTATGLPAGTYIIEELSSDGDHVIDTPPQTVYLSGNDQEVIQVHFGNSPKGSLLVKKVDSVTRQPLSDVEFLVTDSKGNVVGDANGKFVTDSTGSFTVSGIDPGTTLVVKGVRVKDGYILDDVPQTATINAGQTVTLEFRNQPMGSVTLYKFSSVDRKTPLEGVGFKITYADGKVVDNIGGKLSSNGIYYTDFEGQINISGVTGMLIFTEISTIPGYLIDENRKSQTIVVNPDGHQSVYFYNIPENTLIIEKYLETESGNEPLKSVTFLVTDSSGAVVGPNNGEYTSDENGRIVIPNLEPGTVITAKELRVPDGVVLDPTPKSIEIKGGIGGQTLTFINKSTGGLELIKVSESDKTKRIPNVTFEIRRMDGALVDTITTDKQGRAHLNLDAGDFYAVEIECPKEFKLDSTPHYFTIQDGKATTLTVTNKAFSGILIHKTDSTTGKGIYGVSFLLYDSTNTPIGQYTSDNSGYVYIEGLTTSGRYYLRELENKGYVPDTQMKTVYVTAGETTLVEWKNIPITAQIQITKKSADYNPTSGLPAGTPLEGAIFEIYDKAGNLMDTVRSDSRGLTVSKPLPLNRYTIREVKAPANYGVNDQELTAYLEHEGQIVRFEVTNKALTTGVSITKTGPAEIMAGQPVRYTFSNIGNNSNIRLDSFYWRDVLPTEVRLDTVVTGTYNFPGTYKITYRVNGGEPRTLADNLSTSRNYTLAASATALGLASNERVTEVMFVFGQVPGGFAQVEKPMLYCTAVKSIATSSFVNVADVGGVYNGQWVQAISRWVTKVYGKPVIPTLPRTGY